MSGNPMLTEENVLGMIYDHCPDLIALLDANGLFLYSNTAHLVRLGRSADSLIGVTVFELIHPEDAAVFERDILGSVRRRSVFKVSARWLRDGGRDTRFDSLCKWIHADGGRSQYLLLSSREAPRREPAETMVTEANELRADAAVLIARAEDERTAVARAIHDDLGQRLTSLSLELSLWKGELDAGQSRSVNAIREKIAALTNLLHGMINFTRQVTGSLRPRVLEEFGLEAALEWHLEKVQKETGLACSFTSERARIDADAAMTAQVFRIAEDVIAQRVAAGCRSLHVRLLCQAEALALVFEDSGRERRLTGEVCARVRLLGGQVEVSHEDCSIVVALPVQSGHLARDSSPSLD